MCIRDSIQIPRGLRENIIQECEKAGISVDVSDQRETGPVSYTHLIHVFRIGTGKIVH